MLPVIKIGPLALQTPGLIILAGIWFGLSLAERYSYKYQVNANQLYNFVFVVMVTGLIGGRLGYTAAYFLSFKENPASLFSLNPGLFDTWGACAAAVIAGLIYLQKKRLPIMGMADALVPMVGILQIAIALANLTSGNGYGAPASVPWAINLWGTARHPSQIYELIAGLMVLWLIWPGKRLTTTTQPGKSFLLFGVYSAGTKTFLEGFRGDSTLLPGGIRQEQLLAWCLMAACLLGMLFLTKKSQEIRPEA